ncbi:LysR family transcriptional regulator [Streptacidiphilus sp. EB103A]|jgi:DNA-binding transcriptional LysR family regulator|uniref:LysR family transcriptional regulator n=1 Tax=Streptacidiphilus sp. EB103A TaxID=3156275 RepID=UPI003512744A
MAISLRQLEYFITVVDEGSFTRAAELLCVSQPGLSHQIRALERELGGPLLERLPRKVRLTPAGRTALPHARASLAHAQRAGSAARRASGVETGELHVGTLYSISTGVLPGALRTWRRSYPELQVHLVEFPHTNELVAAMEAGQADVAVGPVPAGWDGPCRVIGVEEFVIAAAPDALPHGDGASVRLADLAEREWVHYTQRSGLSDILNLACAQAGFEPKLSVRTEQSSSALGMARAGVGLALLPGNVVPPHFDGVLLRPDPPVRRPLAVYTRVRPDPITAAFVSAISVETLVTPVHITERLGPPPD